MFIIVYQGSLYEVAPQYFIIINLVRCGDLLFTGQAPIFLLEDTLTLFRFRNNRCNNVYHMGTIRQVIFYLMEVTLFPLQAILVVVLILFQSTDFILFFALLEFPLFWQSFLQRLNTRMVSTDSSVTSAEQFNHWLVGFTDGDGTFTIDRLVKPNGTITWVLVFKVSQHKRNLQVLHYIKSKLGVGSISEPKDENCSFRIRDREVLRSVVFPIFDSYFLRTVKYFDYSLIKQAASTLGLFEAGLITKNDCDLQMEVIYSQQRTGPAADYRSPVWDNVDLSHLTFEHIHLLSTDWLIGFWEAEGSFYITKKGPDRYAHGFGLTQKEDGHIQEIIRLIFKGASKVKYNRQGFYSWDSTSKAGTALAMDFFMGRLVGISSQKFSIWWRSRDFKGDDLLQARAKLQDFNKEH